MNQDYKHCTSQLYSIFSSYPTPQNIAGCPCCMHSLANNKWHQKPLQKIEAEQLSDYTFKAITTYGTVNDFRYFLPRILELLSKQALHIDPSIVWSKLIYANWINWPDAEVAVVKQFLMVDWQNNLNNSPIFELDLMITVNKLLGDITCLLQVWPCNFESPAFAKLIQLVVSYGCSKGLRPYEFRALSLADFKQLSEWILLESIAFDSLP